jgi:hypothetical protein
LAVSTRRERKVGSLFVLLAILACGDLVFGIIPIVTGEPEYAIPAGVLFLVLTGLAMTESLLSLRQADHVHGHAGDHSGATEQDGSLPLMTVEIMNPFGGEDHAHEIGLHDFPLGHPARRAMREAAERPA